MESVQLVARLDDIENRLKRIESRIVQLMYSLNVVPTGAKPVRPINQGELDALPREALSE